MPKEHTSEFYGFFEVAFDYFNRTLYNSELPSCIITITRKNGTSGYFSQKQWGNKDGEEINEISINPTYFARSPLVEILVVFVHQMNHLWQNEYGETKASNTYHNTEFVNNLKKIGIETMSIDRGGKTGSKVTHSIIEDGLFLKVCTEFAETGLSLNYADRHISDSLDIGIVGTETDIQAETTMNIDINPGDTDPKNLDDHQAISEPDPKNLDDHQAISEPDPKSLEDDIEHLSGSEHTELEISIKVHDEDKDNTTTKQEPKTPTTKPISSRLTKTAIDTFEGRENFIEPSVSKKKSESKVKFTCSNCNTNAWGKPTLNILCGECNIRMLNKTMLAQKTESDSGNTPIQESSDEGNITSSLTGDKATNQSSTIIIDTGD